MSKGLLLKSVTGLFIPFVALAAQSPSASLQCESLGENNEICLSDVAAQPASKSASAAAASSTGAAKMLTREDLSGGALDLDNEFESNSVLGDATSVPGRDLGATGAAQKAQARIINVDDLLNNVVFSSPQTRVGAARIKNR